MTAIRRKSVAVALLSAAMAVILTACGAAPKPETYAGPEPAEAGGGINQTDHDAPKEIESKELTSFETDFCLETRWNSEEGIFFDFAVKEDGSGDLTAAEKILGISCPADSSLMGGLQDIIERYDLASRNGIYETNFSLAPEYQKCSLTASYASGESLAFTDLNDPYAEWAEEVYDLFAAYFAEHGDESLYPAKEESLIKRIRLEYTADGKTYSYSDTNVPEEMAIDGERHLFNREIYFAESYEEVSDDYILFPEDFCACVTEIIAGTDLVRRYDFSRYDHLNDDYGSHDEGYFGMGGLTTKDGEPDSEDLDLDLYIEYESGRRLNIETKKASEIEGIRPIAEALTAYYDPLFKNS